ncbi:MAG: hypothetical protein WCK31_02890 [bacterium]
MKVKIEKTKNLINQLFIIQVSIFLKSLSKILSVSKLRFFVILFSIFIIISSVTYLNCQVLIFSESMYLSGNTNVIKKDNHELLNSSEKHVGEFTLNALEAFGETYKKVITTFEPLFENFISNTSDVTGKSQKTDSGFIFNVIGYSDIEMSSGAKLKSALYYANRLNLLVVPIMTLLIVIYVFNNLIDNENNKYSLYSILTRIVSTVVLLIASPAILSLSIQASNLLTKFFLQDQTLFEFIKNFFDELVKPTQNLNSLQEMIQNFFSSSLSPIAALQVLPVAIPLMLILLQLIFISFQFIIRYINMYFLTCIYPLAVVFNIHPKTANVNLNFWKTWITLLIHQPFFILGYVIIQDMLSSMLTTGVSLEQIIVFVGMLLFLSTINIIVAKIFGDVFTAITNNVIAAAGTAMINRYSNLKARFTTKKKVTTKKTTASKSIGNVISSASKLIK